MEELGIKLLEELHLSVPERCELPAGGLPLSALTSGVQVRLERVGWFPSPLPAHDSPWIGARIEQRGRELWVHTRHEAGCMTIGPPRSSRVASLGDAIRSYLAATFGGESAAPDGVPVDWDS